MDSTSEDQARNIGGKLILAGFGLLVLAMLFIIVGLLYERFSGLSNASDYFSIAKFIGWFWLPIVIVGIFVRVTAKSSIDSTDSADT